jgi:hypothetical protein
LDEQNAENRNGFGRQKLPANRQHLSKSEKTNLQNSFHELLARFFIQRPTSLSNWEFNAEYNKDRRFREEDIVASMINFPNIVIQFA